MSRARQVANFDPALFAADEVSGDKVSGGTIGAGVIGASVTGGAGLTGSTSLGTVTAGSIGSAVTGYTGIKCADMWYLNTEMESTGGFIVSNYSKHADSIGSVTSADAGDGVFSFSLTGIYLIDFTTMNSYSNEAEWIQGSIWADTGSGYTKRAMGISDRINTSGGQNTGTYCNYIFDVTNTTTHLVKFKLESSIIGKWNGSGQINQPTNACERINTWSFIRLGDT